MPPDNARILENISDDSDEEENSRLSVTDDLNCLLSSFDHKGAVYYCSTERCPPNPALTIEGIGLVGLPLSERDAKLVLSHASRIFEEEDQMDIETAGADYWVIGPDKVDFQNEAWHEYVEKMAATTVWKALGVAPFSTKPRCELKNLVIYQTGSYLAPSQDTCREGGAFATLTFVLPSAFEGGKVHFSHAGEQAVVDVAKESKINTSITAWYKDVTYEVKPVTSGYRLALSYDVVHTSMDKPKPGLPDPNIIGSRLHRVFRKWKRGKYESDMFAYVLSKKYSHEDLNRETQNLRGAEALKVSHLLRASQELGFAMYHAHLVHAEYGIAEMVEINYGSSDVKHPTPSPPPMDDFHDTIEEWSITDFLRLTGREHQTTTGFDIRDPDNKLTFARDIHETRPDDVEYEGDLHEGGGALFQYYYRSVLLLYNEEEEPCSWHSFSENSAWVLREIPFPMQSPGEEVRQIASTFIDNLPRNGYGFEEWGQSDTERLSSSIDLLAGYAACWKDADLWNRIFPFCYESGFTEGFKGVIHKASEIFNFASIQPGFAALIKKIDSLEQRLDLVTFISSHASNTVEPEWAGQVASEALSSYTAGMIADIPRLVSLAKVEGLGIIQEIIHPSRCGTPQKHKFLCELTKALHKDQNQFPASTSAKLETPTDSDAIPQPLTVEHVIRECLSIAVRYYSTYQGPSSSIQDWVCKTVELCLTVGDVHPCVTLLADILQTTPRLNVEDKFYKQLVPAFSDTLRAHGHNVALEPFKSFFQNIISTYFTSILRDKQSIVAAFSERDLKCRCTDCRELERWLNDPTSPEEYHLRAKGPKRSHLEDSIRNCATDLLSCETLRGPAPYTLIVKKEPKALRRLEWDERQAAAMVLLTKIGGEHEWELVMGERYKDVLKAIQGVEGFVLGEEIAVTRAHVITPNSLLPPVNSEDSKPAVKMEDSQYSPHSVKQEDSKDSVCGLMKAESDSGKNWAAVGVKRKRSDSMDSESKGKVKVEAD